MTDITKHKWSDTSLVSDIDLDGDILIRSKWHGDNVLLQKSDAIAIAKHFGITKELEDEISGLNRALHCADIH